MTTLISTLIVVAAAVVGLCSVAPAASAREEPQIVAGTNYRLVIQATKGGGAGKSATYGAVVYEKVDKTRQLLSFNPAN